MPQKELCDLERSERGLHRQSHLWCLAIAVNHRFVQLVDRGENAIPLIGITSSGHRVASLVFDPSGFPDGT
ncbi:hypothetical protein RHEC894_PE00133 (plasmid) [Rhizobium sp. CIAT894]|nr:hypothetical protein RHEC894_PE00133 [Rhizobium sp. CIAT894]